MNSVTKLARSKINIGLDVLGTFPNGYHEVRMVMQTLGLHDVVTLTALESDEIRLTIKLEKGELEADETNLCYKAAKLIKEKCELNAGVDIVLEKNIPIAAGMAGGSTDAAAVLTGMNELFDLGLSLQELMDLGVRLGADVPYCIMEGTALAEGIGEKLTRLDAMMECPVLIAKPDISVSTKMVYESLDSCFENVVHPDIDRLIADMKAKDLKAICSDMGNVLQDVTVPMHPVISKIKEFMMEHGAAGSMMSGSGPTVFGFFEDATTANEAAKELEKTGLANQIFVTWIYNV